MTQPEQTNGGRVARNTTYLTLALIGQKVLSSLYYFIIIRIVGPSNAGDFIGATAVTTIFAVLIDVGLTTSFIRYVAREPQNGRPHFRQIMTFKLVSSVIVTALLFGSIHWLASLKGIGGIIGIPNVHYLWWAAASMVLDSLTATSYGYFRGLQHLEYESLGTIFHRVTVMVVGISGAVLKAPPVITIVAVVAGSSINFLYSQFQLWRRQIIWSLRWSSTEMLRLLRVSWPFGLADFFKAIYASSDNILLTLFADRYIVGLYGFALKGLLTFQLVPSALVNAIFPALSAAYLASRERLQQLFLGAIRYLTIIVVPITVIFFLLARTIILFFGQSETWTPAILPLRILVLGLPFLFLNFPVGYLLNAANMERINTRNIMIVVVINIVTNLIFIKKYTYVSVAIDSSLCTILLFSLGVFYVRRLFPIPWRSILNTVGRSALAGLAVAFAGWWMLPHARGLIGILWAGSAMGGIYVVLIFILGLVTKHDVRYLVRRLRSV